MAPTYDTLRDLLQTCGYVLDPCLVPVGSAGWCDPYIRRRREMFGLPLVITHPQGSP